jgi:glucosamine 6-phosphate synthetase-like amidotransferase/phosphosugar isomerase protein
MHMPLYKYSAQVHTIWIPASTLSIGIDMNSIDAMEKEIISQIHHLPKLDLPMQVDLDDCLFIGAGDSYAAALVALYASDYKIVCSSPMEIVFNPEIINKNNYRRIYIVSISGNTRSNILAAMISRKYKISTTAITAAPKSMLARTCDNVIELKYRNAGILTSGTASFTSSMLCCLSLARKVDDLERLRRIYRQSSYEASTLVNGTPERVGSYIFLGDGLLFPIALYGTLKINEVLGLKAFAYHFDDFCHSPLFSLKMNDRIIILANDRYTITNSKQFSDQLRKLGFFSACIIDCSKLSSIELLLKSTFVMQLFVLKQALKKGVKDCYYLRNKNLLKVSSDLIYYHRSV